METGRGYFPSISTRVGEISAYDRCDEATKDLITPIVTLARYKVTESFAEAATALVAGLEGRPAVVDFDPIPRLVTSAAEALERRERSNLIRLKSGRKAARPRSAKELANDAERTRKTEAFNLNLRSLLDPLAGPYAWLELTRAFPELTPALRLANREVLRGQLEFMGRAGRRAAVRVRVDELKEVEAFQANLAVIAANAGAVDLILDADNIWGRTRTSTEKVASLLERVEKAAAARMSELRVIVLSTSFPKVALKGVESVLQIEDLALHETLRRRFDIQYGDYASLPNRTEDVIARGWFPHVDLVTDDEWHIELVEENRNAAGYVTAAEAIVAKPQWRERADCWGSRIIAEVSGGAQIVDDKKYTHPSPWLTVRMNQHLTKMALRNQ